MFNERSKNFVGQSFFLIVYANCQEILHFLWKRKFRYCVRKIPALFPEPAELRPRHHPISLGHILILYFCLSINPPNFYYPLGKTYEFYIFFMPSTGPVSPVILVWLHYSIWLKAKFMKLLITLFLLDLLVYCFFVSHFLSYIFSKWSCTHRNTGFIRK
jgi:hypothetical protein